jgi:hypothetical protein
LDLTLTQPAPGGDQRLIVNGSLQQGIESRQLVSLTEREGGERWCANAKRQSGKEIPSTDHLSLPEVLLSQNECCITGNGIGPGSDQNFHRL